MCPLTGHTADCPLVYSAAGGDPLYTVLHTLYSCTQVEVELKKELWHAEFKRENVMQSNYSLKKKLERIWARDGITLVPMIHAKV